MAVRVVDTVEIYHASYLNSMENRRALSSIGGFGLILSRWCSQLAAIERDGASELSRKCIVG